MTVYHLTIIFAILIAADIIVCDLLFFEQGRIIPCRISAILGLIFTFGFLKTASDSLLCFTYNSTDASNRTQLVENLEKAIDTGSGKTDALNDIVSYNDFLNDIATFVDGNDFRKRAIHDDVLALQPIDISEYINEKQYN